MLRPPPTGSIGHGGEAFFRHAARHVSPSSMGRCVVQAHAAADSKRLCRIDLSDRSVCWRIILIGSSRGAGPRTLAIFVADTDYHSTPLKPHSACRNGGICTDPSRRSHRHSRRRRREIAEEDGGAEARVGDWFGLGKRVRSAVTDDARRPARKGWWQCAKYGEIVGDDKWRRHPASSHQRGQQVQ